jgi:protein-disulfide isomerase-like protein with CxxC motif
MEQVTFVFDPLCPWCYQTSRWAKQLERLGEVELDWGLFSLEVVNLEEGMDPLELRARSGPALRTATLVRRRRGSKAIGALYSAIGRQTWESAPPEADMATAVRAALAETGSDPAWCDEALADSSTWEEVVEEHRGFVARTRGFGVPTIVLDGGEGLAIFGPVISELPSDSDAVELWRHVAWLARYANFSELKRDRAKPPDLPAVEWRRREREAAAAH